jgi:hypothetical protein
VLAQPPLEMSVEALHIAVGIGRELHPMHHMQNKNFE